MLTYTIRPKSIVERTLGRVFNWPYNTVEDTTPVFMRMGKYEYGKFIDIVKTNFKVGDLVTLSYVAFQANAVPLHYVITYIEELHQMVAYDAATNTPLCISCRTLQGIVIQKCPSSLRKLTAQEEALVNLSNQKCIGTA